MRRRRLSSITRAPCRKVMPTFTGGVVGGERNLVILDAGDVLDDAFPVSSPRIDAEGEMRSRFHRRRSFPQSSSASRLTAGAAGFFIFS
jgi:hypothetical protein